MTYGVCFSIGYFIYDNIYLMTEVRRQEGWKGVDQHVFHHFFAMFCLGSALLAGYSMIGFAALGMLCEFSTIFMCISMMYNSAAEKKNTPCLVFN